MINQSDIAIVIAGYNRDGALKRVLQSISNAELSTYTNITLYISLDNSGNDHCKIVADEFVWTKGKKICINQTHRLGLKEHIYTCASLSQKHDAIILLEDDLYVSPFFYDFAQQAISFYSDDRSVAGIALYSYNYCEFALCPFEALNDGHDNYFIQVPCSWGQIWTKQQWKDFEEYRNSGTNTSIEEQLPAAAQSWPKQSSWKREFFCYMIETDKYFVHPRISLSTNYGDIGQHFTNDVLVWQTPLLAGKKTFSFSELVSSCSVYDSFFELHPKALNRIMKSETDVCIDLNGLKPLKNVTSKFLISSKRCTKPIKKFETGLYPYENNIIFNRETSASESMGFSLGEVADFESDIEFKRMDSDVRRVFFKPELVAYSFINEVYNSATYKAGKIVTKPFRFIRKIIRNRNTGNNKNRY